MTTQTQTLASFLLARIAEDEAAARAAVPTGARRNGRTLARRRIVNCEAKRRIVARACVQEGERLPGADAMRFTLLDLALPYADHPDYREEWRP